LDTIWLVRKQALAQVRLGMTSQDTVAPPETPLTHLVPRQGFQAKCPGFDRACEALLHADALLRDAKFDHELLLQAYHRFEEAKVLAKLYQSTQSSTMAGMKNDPTDHQPQQQQQSIIEDMKRTLEKLRQQLVPGGLSQPSEQTIQMNAKLVWQELQHLSILIEAQESLSAQQQQQQQLQSEASYTPPVGVCTAGSSAVPPADPAASRELWGIASLVALFLMVPMFLLLKKMMGQAQRQNQNQKPQEAALVVVQETENSQPATPRVHVISPLTLEEKVNTNNDRTSDKAIAMLKSLDRIEAELQGMLCHLNQNNSKELLANKVSALVCLHKTRQSLLARVMGEVEDDDEDQNRSHPDDDDDDDENSLDIRQSGLAMEVEFQTFVHRMQELGFESLVTDLVYDVTQQED
jgi:hypothetical protein